MQNILYLKNAFSFSVYVDYTNFYGFIIQIKRLEALDVRINTVTEKNIDDYHLSLRLVGLDFNFKE